MIVICNDLKEVFNEINIFTNFRVEIQANLVI